MSRRSRLFLVATLISVLTLIGCASLSNVQMKKIADRRMEFVCNFGSGPAVVFENGLGGRMEWWRDVLPEIAKESTCFAYNRPGYGKSSSVTTPRDGTHIVDELRVALRSEGIEPPYVLVGHSLGGLYMQLFARKYPDEVAALVLVDSTHPNQLEGDGAMENQPFWVRTLFATFVGGEAKEELGLAPQTGQQLLELPTLTETPIFVLSASKPMNAKSKQARFANEKRTDIARMYPGSQQIWVDSGHAIPIERPEAVISAIQDAIRAATAVSNQ